ncbi:Ras family protein [Dictyocaulus viviparus]|uniref:Ras family protein n=1 Tax=Dictyocaulus viviparus TaxID=29172 RepID=A0A0D8XIN9_DICVI|nr:Ras family protein [Dictyocaulus viviparus]
MIGQYVHKIPPSVTGLKPHSLIEVLRGSFKAIFTLKRSSARSNLNAVMEQYYSGVTVVEEPQVTAVRFKILFLGRSGSGKSTLIYRLKNNVFPTAANTATFPNVTSISRKLHGLMINADLVELAEFFLRFGSSNAAKVHYVEQTLDVNGLFLVYDITNLDSFYEITKVLPFLEQTMPPAVDICFVGTKADLIKCRQVPFKDADYKSSQLGFSLFETSSLTGINCEESLLEILDKILERKSEDQEYFIDSTAVYQTTTLSGDDERDEPNVFCWISKILWRQKKN